MKNHSKCELSAAQSRVINGADDEARTRYLHLGKVALYQMSYIRIWCLRTESNHRHGDFQSPALPTELQKHIMATRNGLEPSTSCVTGRRSNQLNYRAIYKSICKHMTYLLNYGGNYRARTYDPLLVRQMLSQLSYAPKMSPYFSDEYYYIRQKSKSQ